MSRSNAIIIYGSYGYTGKLIVDECKSKNLNVILAGRNENALKLQSKNTGFPFEVADATDPVALNKLLSKGFVVIHCAGPFQFTAKAMVAACLETQTHYTDITGEHQVFETLALHNEPAKRAGITIIPGTGFDVVPSDCLAVHLKNRLPTANNLQLAFSMAGGGLSRGTAKTSVEGLGYGSMVRTNGKLSPVALGGKVIEVDFGSFKSKALNIPWGDISTAWRSTGIPNIEIYMGASDKIIFYAKMSNYFNWLLRNRRVKNFLRKKIEDRPEGPDEKRRSDGRCYLWGKAWDQAGNIASSRMETTSGYALTAKASVLIAEKILQRNFKAGYQTPAGAYGEHLVMEIEGTQMKDL